MYCDVCHIIHVTFDGVESAVGDPLNDSLAWNVVLCGAEGVTEGVGLKLLGIERLITYGQLWLRY